MEAVAYSWLAAASSSPLLLMLALWTIYIFHTYRRQWRMVDLFLLAVVAQEFVTSAFVFAFAILRLISPKLEPPCVFVQWGLTATRTFQIATLTSLALDRALTIRWPYKYRFSVRRNQIRYHIAVLAVISVFVGVAAVFARVPIRGACSVQPLAWDTKFSIFLVSLYAILVITAAVCCADVACQRCKRSPKRDQLRTLAIGDFGTACSGSGSSTSGGSSRPLRPLLTTLDIRWSAVSSVCICCYVVNHIPFLTFNVLALAIPTFWSAWQENIIVWLRLAEAISIPSVLYFTDLPHRGAVKKAFQRKSGRFPEIDGHSGRLHPYLDDILISHKTIPSSFLSTSQQPMDLPIKRQFSSFGARVGWHDQVIPNFYALPHQSDIYTKNLHMMLESRGCLTKHSSIETDLPEYSADTWKEDGSHIYATLSESASFQSVFTSEQREVEEDDGESVTTDANDDFEFHPNHPHPIYRQEADISEEEPEYNVDSCSEDSLSDDDDEEKIEDNETMATDEGFLKVYKMSTEHLQQNALEEKASEDDIVGASDGDEGEEEEIYVLPVAPRSSMALYKLQLPRPFKARSETDLSWLSRTGEEVEKNRTEDSAMQEPSAILAALNKNPRRNVKRRTSLKESAVGPDPCPPPQKSISVSGFV